MKKHSTNIRMFLSAIILTGTMLSPIYAQEYGLKKGRNISLSINNHKPDTRKTYFNLGLFSNYQNLNGASINIISDVIQFGQVNSEEYALVCITGTFRCSDMKCVSRITAGI